jgi:hypothetical protein
MSKQTAVEFLAKSLKDFPHIKHSQSFKDLVNQAKAMEKEQTEESMAHAITFGWELSHYHRDKEPEVLLKMQKDFITCVIKGGEQ